MNIDEINTRLSAIASEMNAEGADLDALSAEVDQLQARKQELLDAESKRKALSEKIATDNTAVEVIATNEDETEERTMNKDELRNSPAYIDAYAEYVKSGYDRNVFAEAARALPEDQKELRTLMTNQVEGGTVAVPVTVEDRVTTNWQKEQIMGLVPVVDISGEYQVQFEISGSDATKHAEDGDPVAEEELSLGIATIDQDSWKKWIGVTKKTLKTRGQAFLDYIYDELEHKLAVGAAGELIDKIKVLPAVATATTPSAQAVTAAPDVDTVALATAELSAEAESPVIVINRKTEAKFTAAAKRANYAMDVYEGLPRVYTNKLPAYDAANAGDVYMIIADFATGARRTRPEGEDDTEFTFDTLTQKKKNIVEIQGEKFGGVGVVACDRFTLVKKPEGI